jgi:nitrate reductase gamma subunit
MYRIGLDPIYFSIHVPIYFFVFVLWPFTAVWSCTKKYK